MLVPRAVPGSRGCSQPVQPDETEGRGLFMPSPLGAGFSMRRLQQVPGRSLQGPGHAPECGRGASHELGGAPLLALTLESKRWGCEVQDCTQKGAPKEPTSKSGGS